MSRDHVISVNPATKTLFVAGGKWTTYREMAEDAVDEAIKLMSPPRAEMGRRSMLIS